MPDQANRGTASGYVVEAAERAQSTTEAEARAKREQTQHWAVTVRRNGEEIVTIESNCLSGREISAEDEKVIRMAARHLLAFIGDGEPSDSRKREDDERYGDYDFAIGKDGRFE